MPQHLSSFYPTTTLVQEIMINVTQTILPSETTYDLDVVDDDDYMLIGSKLIQYRDFYRNYHGITSSIVCVFGIVCNLFNIIVLTRPIMRSSTNMILTSLALSDLLKMLFVLPASILFYCLAKPQYRSEPDSNSYFQVKFYMIQMLFTLTLHCISTWLTVYLAGFRYFFLSCQSLTAYLSVPDRVLIGVIIVVVLSTILCIPSFVEHRIVTIYVNHTYSSLNKTELTAAYRFEETEFSRLYSLRGTVFVLHGVVFKLIPCLFLLLFSALLIQQLRHALQRTEIVFRHSTAVTSPRHSHSGRLRCRKREKENRRTTLMLVIVCILFLVTELPQGAILLLTFIFKNHKIYFQIYQHLGDTFDILALINHSVNFILYCLMSRAFRDTLRQILRLSNKSQTTSMKPMKHLNNLHIEV